METSLSGVATSIIGDCRESAALMYGESVSRDLVHFWTFKGGKAIELVEFFDTAHVARIMSKTPPQLAG